MSDGLDEASVRRALLAHVSEHAAPILVHESTESTNDDAKRLAAEGAPEGTIVIADRQLAGRGRGGSAWHSPAGEGLYLSVILRPGFDPAASAPFALVVGLVVARAVEARIDALCRIKWPNDLWIGERKVAGVLVEGQIRGDALVSLVVGVGLNVSTASFPEEIATSATSLVLEGAPAASRSELAAEIALGVLTDASIFAERGLSPFHAEIARRDLLAGRAVSVGGVSGVAREIAPTGELVVVDPNGTEQRVRSGHVEIVTRASVSGHPKGPGSTPRAPFG